MVCGDLRSHAAHHYRLDGGQEFSDHWGRNAEGGTKREGRAHVPADHRAGDDAQLTPKAPNKVPDLRALPGLRRVQPCGTLGADEPTGGAIASAPAELPIGKGDETFFSASRSRPLAT